MNMEQAGTTLRDTIEAAITEVETASPQVEEKQVEAQPEEKPGRTAGRARDESGRLLPGKAEKPEAEVKAEVKPEVPVKPRPQYPSTWKKDYQPKWETIDPDLAEEIHRRESDFAKGVSTYKTEYERVKPLDEALKPYMPFLQHSNIKPDEFVRSLAQADQTLRYGSVEEKIRAFAKLAQDYQVPVHQMLVQGEDGKIYFNQQYSQPQQQATQGMTPQDIQRLIQQETAKVKLETAVQQFMATKDTSGNPLYPHFEKQEVRATMDGLLRAGLAKDLPDAYAKAMRMPEHAELMQAEENSRRKAEKAEEVQAKAQQAARAKASNVSVKSQSPTGPAVNDAGRKGLRSQIEAAFDQHSGGGRV